MSSNLKTSVVNDRWSNERGVALITTLLVSTLLLIVGGALILTTNLAHGLAIDSTSELQAYYSAEAGTNAAVNVLRGNIASNPAGTNATFRNAVTTPTLDTWLTYDATIDGTSVVSLSTNPVMGYTVAVSDPDNTPVGRVPERLLVRVTGFGPKGARKRMELWVDRHIFDYSPMATILMRGNDDNTTPLSGFAIGNSNAKEYSGIDNFDPTKSLPVFGVTNGNDLTAVTNEVNSAQPNTVTGGGNPKEKQFTNSQLPDFLKTADQARSFLTSMQATAVTNGRYYTSTPASLGTSSAPKLTFIDGDATLSEGAGLLIVTGKLTQSGNVPFQGLILVLGEGYLERDGTGSSDTLGAIIVAKFDRNTPAGPFLSPTYDMNGGGSGTTRYDSDSVDKALSVVGLRSVGVREY
jgi:hypothetical protein